MTSSPNELPASLPEELADLAKKWRDYLNIGYEDLDQNYNLGSDENPYKEGWYQAARAGLAVIEVLDNHIATLEQEREWLPIADAPRDGTHILAIYQRNPEAEEQCVEVWWSDRDDVYPWHSWNNAYPDDDDKIIHWQPLPKPPTQSQQAERMVSAGEAEVMHKALLASSESIHPGELIDEEQTK